MRTHLLATPDAIAWECWVRRRAGLPDVEVAETRKAVVKRPVRNPHVRPVVMSLLVTARARRLTRSVTCG
jgi:hypothetical protein